MVLDIVENLLEKLAPEQRAHLKRWRHRLLRPAWLGTIHNRTRPLSDEWGTERGTPVDRYYIEGFLEENCQDIQGHVLEVRDSSYTERFGRNISRIDVLDIDPVNHRATIVADLTAADGIPANEFDCFILTQTLHFIYDAEAAVRHAYRILRPGGILLVTVPVVSRLAPRYGLQKDFWRFTPASCLRLFGECFEPGQVTVRSYGNMLTAINFLAGVAHEELSPKVLAAHDEYFPVIVAVRAVKQ